MTILASLGFLHFSPVDILDIIMVAAVIYFVFRWIKGTSAMNIFVAILMLVLLRVLVGALNMKMMSAILGTVLDLGAIAIIIIFQPEIRKFLGGIGRATGSTIEKRSFIDKFLGRTGDSISGGAADEIASACIEMAGQKTGALIVLRRRNMLDDIIATGDTLDAGIKARLLTNIFFKNAPLHDGAVVIGGDRILAARCTLPISERIDLPAHYGMRHKAAVGLSEQSDADIIVVSEQTGRISFVRGGAITPVESKNVLKYLISGGADKSSAK